MSASTPAASAPTPENATPTAPTSLENLSAHGKAVDKVVLDYLRTRGYTDATERLQRSLEDEGLNADGSTVSVGELIKDLADLLKPAPTTADESKKDALPELGSPPSVQALLASIGPVGAEDILSTDPLDRQQGYRELESWVDGSLDMYRPEFRPILFPIFCHFYLDLVQYGYKDAAIKFFDEFSPSLMPSHNLILHRLSTLSLPIHVRNDELAQRFRNEKYAVRMSRSGFSLLVGWLTEGIGGEALGEGSGFTGERGKRGRSAVMRVVNNHLRFDVTSASTTSVHASSWEESTGLLSSLLPAGGSYTNPQAFNTAKGELKLGPKPLNEELRLETERTLREHAMLEPSGQYDQSLPQPNVPGLVSPTTSELAPHPPLFKQIDVRREVERVRDARKRIRLEPSVLGNVDINSPQGAAIRSRVLPSICAYTLHDVGEGVPCCTFSPDTSLMAAGFSESYIRLWSLKGEKLRGMRSDFQSSAIKDANSLRRIKERGGSTTRKLIGHSGPVYSVAFDPHSGSAAPPKYLLSGSADGTARLWSLDTMTNIVAYRGHQNPIWDVEWSPLGVYFASASRDRTARLWSTDRVSTLRVYAGHLSDVDCVRFHPNSLYLATASSDQTARLWDVQKGSCVRVFIGHQGKVSTLAFSPDGKYLATAGEDLAINLWDLGSGRRIKKMAGHTAPVYSLAFSAESSLLVSGGADWTVRCWDVRGAGGLPSKAKENGMLANGTSADDSTTKPDVGIETLDLLSTFPTKRTPIINVQFTPRNLCMVAGPFLSPEPRLA